MTITEIRDICLSFPGVTEDIKWEDHLCFNIGGKMFLVTAPDNIPISASFKTSEEDFEALPNLEGFIPAPYMARNKWIFVDDINRLSYREWGAYLHNSYKLILSKLSLKFQREIAGYKSGNKLAVKRESINNRAKAKKSAKRKKVEGKKKKVVKRKKIMVKTNRKAKTRR